MFTKTPKIIQDNQNLDNYMQDTDVYNSRLIKELKNPIYKRVEYEITSNPFRPDLIAQSFYGDTSYQGILILQTGIGLGDYRIGTILRLLSKEDIDSLIEHIGDGSK